MGWNGMALEFDIDSAQQLDYLDTNQTLGGVMAAPIPRRKFTVEQYYQMAETGILAPDERVELIEGEIIEMSPIGPRHLLCVNKLTKYLNRQLDDSIMVNVQNPIRLDDFSEPEPDISLIKDAEFLTDVPSAAATILAIEVADSTLDRDRTIKQKIYANANIPEFWIVNLPEDVVEVYRNPAGDAYQERILVSREEHISPQLLPNLVLSGEEILG
jgi:Uma2 family endonuclease